MARSRGSEQRKEPGAATPQEAFAALSQLLDLMRDEAHGVVGRLGLPLSAAMALIRLDAPVAMSKLGHELGCDPSFVTSLADTLEQQGMVVRTPDPLDRRVRKLRLTAKGRATKAKLEADFAETLPGIRALDPEEREAFVGLLRKMVSAERDDVHRT
jgi:DNA-binding MarR family transcriptional regulator